MTSKEAGNIIRCNRAVFEQLPDGEFKFKDVSHIKGYDRSLHRKLLNRNVIVKVDGRAASARDGFVFRVNKWVPW